MDYDISLPEAIFLKELKRKTTYSKIKKLKTRQERNTHCRLLMNFDPRPDGTVYLAGTCGFIRLFGTYNQWNTAATFIKHNLSRTDNRANEKHNVIRIYFVKIYLDKDPRLLESGINLAPFLSHDLHSFVTSRYDGARFL